MEQHPVSKRRVSANTDRLRDIKLLLLDVDGVLTDGRIVYHDDGTETKSFSVRDGLGLRLLMEGGIHVGIVTGRRSGALHHRCRDLGIDCIYEGVADKAKLLDTICAEKNIPASATAFVGDDLPDIPIMKRVGIAIAVGDAHEAVTALSDLVTEAAGGAGAVREVCEAVLKSHGLWDRFLKRFHDDPCTT